MSFKKHVEEVLFRASGGNLTSEALRNMYVDDIISRLLKIVSELPPASAMQHYKAAVSAQDPSKLMAYVTGFEDGVELVMEELLKE